MSILGIAGIVLIIFSYTAAALLMFRAINAIGSAARPVDATGASDVSVPPRPTSIYNYGDDTTLLAVLLVGLVVGGLLLIFNERENQQLFFLMGLGSLITSVLSAVTIMVVGLFGINVPSSSATGGWVIFFIEILASIIFLAIDHNGGLIKIIGVVLIAISLLSVFVVLFGAVLPGRIPDVDRSTLWLMFGSSLVLGILVLYLPGIFANLFGWTSST